MLTVIWVGNFRFLSPGDIDGEGLTKPAQDIKVLQAILHNTHEQALIFLCVNWLLLSARERRAEYDGIVRLNALLFFLGRACFASSYKNGAPGRSFGFAVTMMPQMISLVMWTAQTVLEALAIST